LVDGGGSARPGLRGAGVGASVGRVAVSDASLAARVADGDVGAFRELYARHARDVFVLTAHLVGRGAAEEVVQDVFVAVWRRADRFDPARGSFGAWLAGIARHRALDELQRRRRAAAAVAVEALLAEAVAAGPGPDEVALRDERRERVLRALAAVPPEQRRALVLAYFGGLSQREIAERLGWPLGTVKKRVRLGLDKLRASLAEEVGVEEGERRSIAT
jgi:RNA polymerase sigma-70 factor, ECF subfamily